MSLDLHTEPDAPSLRHGGLSKLTRDLATLLEYQLDLFELEAQAALKGIVVPVILTFVGILLAQAAVVLLLVGFACYLAAASTATIVGFVSSGAIAAMAAILCVSISSALLKRQTGMRAAWHEFRSNWKCLTQAMTRSRPAEEDLFTTNYPR